MNALNIFVFAQDDFIGFLFTVIVGVLDFEDLTLVTSDGFKSAGIFKFLLELLIFYLIVFF